MKIKKNDANWDKSDFKEFLIKKTGKSPRVATDYISRISTLETKLKINLIDATSTAEKYNSLMLKIQEYCQKKYIKTRSVYSNTGNFRLAARNFAVYKWGKIILSNYPSNRYY